MDVGSKRIDFLDTFYDDLTLEGVLAIIDDHIESGVPGFMSSINTQLVILHDNDDFFAESFDDVTVSLMDSQPLIWLARSMGLHVSEKISGSDLIYPVCELAARKSYSCYMLGGAPGVPERAATNLISQYPGLNFVGTSSPPLGFMHDVDALEEVAKSIIEAKPDIVFVCISAPNREILTDTILKDCGVPFCLCVGAAVDFVAGDVKRAPKWVSEHGLEWLYRVIQDPKRLFKRYFVESWDIIKIYRRFRKRWRHNESF